MFNLDDMHDAAEALGEIFDCLHRAQVGPPAVGAVDPFLPRPVSVHVSDTQGWAAGPAAAQQAQQAPPAVVVANGSPVAKGLVWGNGAALLKVKQAPEVKAAAKAQSVVQRMFGMEVQVPVAGPNGNGTSGSSGKTSGRATSQATGGGSNKNPSTGNTKSSSNSSKDGSSGTGTGTAGKKVGSSSNTIEALQYTKYFHLVPASGLRNTSNTTAQTGGSFEEALIAAESIDHSSNTSSTTPGRKSLPLTRLLSRPKVVTLGVVWESPQAPADAIAATMHALSTSLDISKAFAGVSSSGAGADSVTYHLQGLVCYSRSHYKAFALSREVGAWLLFDDADVSVVGGWKEVAGVVMKERLQPSVLFYEVNRS